MCFANGYRNLRLIFTKLYAANSREIVVNSFKILSNVANFIFESFLTHIRRSVRNSIVFV